MLRGDDERDKWVEMVFRPPPHRPDARDVYLGGCGLVTVFRGLSFLSANPDAHLFTLLGQVFITSWAWIWVLTGLFVTAVAFTGHRWPELDRYAAFVLMMAWWVLGFIYLLSVPLDSDRRVADAYTGVAAVLTGVALTAGVIISIRKTQEINLRVIAVQRIRELEEQGLALAEENGRLRAQGDKSGPSGG